MPLTRAGVLGWPVRHSRSPAMHEAAYAAVGLKDWRYQLLPVPPPLLAETVRALPAAGFAGANVTIPHKEAALALADEASDPARAIGAATAAGSVADPPQPLRRCGGGIHVNPPSRFGSIVRGQDRDDRDAGATSTDVVLQGVTP